MTEAEATFNQLIAAIIANDNLTVAKFLDTTPELAYASVVDGATRANAADNYYAKLGHHLYVGDTALHIAAAAYRTTIILKLVEAGADVAAHNRRGAQPLHYAADGQPGSITWNPAAQGAAVTALIEAGADPNAKDKGGVTPLHRAVRTRCTAAVVALLDGGADRYFPTKTAQPP